MYGRICMGLAHGGGKALVSHSYWENQYTNGNFIWSGTHSGSVRILGRGLLQMFKARVGTHSGSVCIIS